LAHVSSCLCLHSEVVTVSVPNIAESITEGTLKSWTKQVGDQVDVNEEVAVIETDKVDVSVNAEVAGKIVELLANEEDTVAVGAELFRIEAGAAGECKSLLPFIYANL
jgi:2-oxoglutarate dehydrogenase E2 component (dihydrolipoamide succinyltransferase)